MIVGIGTDIVDRKRFEQAAARGGKVFLERFLTEEELAEAEKKEKVLLEYAAGRWAAKEAVSKMLGCGMGGKCAWRDITIRNCPGGAPSVALGGAAEQTANALGISRIFLSISHERSFATAVAIGEKDS